MTAQARGPPPAAAGWRSNPAIQFAAGVALGGLQGWVPGGFAADVVPLPTKSSELGRGVGETAMGVAQMIVGLGATGVGGTAAVAGGAAVPVTGGASLAVTAGGGALATAGVASMAQGAVNVVAGAATLNRALHMSGDSDGAPPAPEPEPKVAEAQPHVDEPAAAPTQPEAPARAAARDPIATGQHIGESTRSMQTGKRAKIAEAVSREGLPQADAVAATRQASTTAFGRVGGSVRLPNGDVVVPSVQVGSHQPIFVVKPDGQVQRALATIKVEMTDLANPLRISDIVIQ